MYCSAAEVETEIGRVALAQLSSETGDTVNTSVVNTYIAEESGFIDSYLRLRYTTPIATPPVPIKKYSRRLVVLALYRKRRALTQDENAEYSSIIAWLLNVQKGIVALDAVPIVEESQRSGFIRANSRKPVISTEGY